jgi:NAD(P)-dependent dehydrogenase (short-subunit alcohol dehydrogenase family)
LKIHNPFTLENKTILVTGASSGIGKGIAIECSKMGAHVLVTGRHKDRLQETYDLLDNSVGQKHNSIIADLDDEKDIQMLADFAQPLDGLVNCAGVVKSQLFQFVNSDTIYRILKTNFVSATLLTQKLIKIKKMKTLSSIVFISSISGTKIMFPGNSLYSASKAAISGVAKGIALEQASKKIRVNTITPGMVDTHILTEGTITQEQLAEDIKKYPLKRYGTPEDIAYAAIYLLSDASSWVTGTDLLIDGGYTLQ